MLGVDFITKTVMHNAGNMQITDKKRLFIKGLYWEKQLITTG